MRPTELPPQEAVAAALDRVDREINRGHSPTDAIFKVAADIGVEYNKLEHFYIERGRGR